ncbi:hypothetical protein AB4564_08720 [Vibrio sp. 10N.222.51.E8]|uniref:hypothetical protein n=1 Tax=unclassified Vibrio TaxID=2614977 RepID=UPI0010BD4E83|nr:hypothetical protein [Vibrio sp. F13]TKG35715.1 hypothetical protein FCV85_03540 [Vibrio sp. F13]
MKKTFINILFAVGVLWIGAIGYYFITEQAVSAARQMKSNSYAYSYNFYRGQVCLNNNPIRLGSLNYTNAKTDTEKKRLDLRNEFYRACIDEHKYKYGPNDLSIARKTSYWIVDNLMPWTYTGSTFSAVDMHEKTNIERSIHSFYRRYQANNIK